MFALSVGGGGGCSHICVAVHIQTYSEEQGSFIIHYLPPAPKVNMCPVCSLVSVFLQAGNRTWDTTVLLSKSKNITLEMYSGKC